METCSNEKPPSIACAYHSNAPIHIIFSTWGILCSSSKAEAKARKTQKRVLCETYERWGFKSLSWPKQVFSCLLTSHCDWRATIKHTKKNNIFRIVWNKERIRSSLILVYLDDSKESSGFFFVRRQKNCLLLNRARFVAKEQFYSTQLKVRKNSRKNS